MPHTPGFIETHITCLSTEYAVRFHPDGSGEVLWTDPATGAAKTVERFAHSLDVRRDLEDRRDDPALVEEYAAAFWDDINPELDDPFLLPGDLDGEPLEWTGGDEQALADTIRLFVLTEPRPVPLPATFVISAACEDEPAAFDAEASDYSSARLELLIAMALEDASPVGWTWEYNDGAWDQRSGYSITPERVALTVPPASGHERAAAIARFLAWLEERRRRFSAAELRLAAGHLLPDSRTEPASPRTGQCGRKT